MKVVEGENCVEAWLAGARTLIESHGEVFNLLTTIQNPTFLDDSELTRYNPSRHIKGADNLKSVINTIFPINIIKFSESRDDAYQRYLQAMGRGQKIFRGHRSWGTYFERLTKFGATSTNQLERAINKLRNWDKNPRSAIVFHLSSPETDSPRPRGGPCLQFVELCCHKDGTCDMVAVYRSHDFVNKTLGNFVALGQLLEFICDHSGKKSGKLICHSVRAFYSTKQSMQTLCAA